MGRILRRRESAQEDSENVLHGRLEAKRKQKTYKLLGVTAENKSPARGQKNPIVRNDKRMALVDKTNKPSPPRDLTTCKDGNLKLADVLNRNKSPIPTKVSRPVKDTEEAPATPLNGVEKLDGLKENRAPPRYRVSPIERPVTRSRKNKGKPSKASDVVKGKCTKRKRDDDGKNSKNKAVTDVGELSAIETPKPQLGQTSCRGLVERVSVDDVAPTNKGNDVQVPESTGSVLKSKSSDTSAPSKLERIPEKSDENVGPVLGRSRKNCLVSSKGKPSKASDVVKGKCTKRKRDDGKNSKNKAVTDVGELSAVETPKPQLGQTSCRVLVERVSVDDVAPTNKGNDVQVPESTGSVLKSKSSDTSAPSKLERIPEKSDENVSPVLEPTPSCSNAPGFETPFKKPTRPSGRTKASPKDSNLSIFTCFKKPDTPRRNSSENKIFVSGSKQTPSTNLRNARNPVYACKNMTPLRRRTSLASEQKEGLYDFEVDESEPKPKKKQRPIMKIQRVRAYKQKKPKVYVADPEMEMRLLRNLDLSPSIMKQTKVKRVENANKHPASKQPSTTTQCVETVAPSSVPQTDCFVESGKAPSSDGGIYDVDMDHDGDYDVDPAPSSPCSKYGSSTPLQSAHDKSRDSLLDESIHRFGGLSAKLYSPVKAKSSPIPVLLENYNNDPVRSEDSDRRSVVSCCTSYQHDLDISASTPVKFHKRDSTLLVTKQLKPAELNVSNCFGFDEPEVMEEPLVSPIKTTIYVPPPVAPPARAARLVKKKLLVAPPAPPPSVDVEEVIKQLRSEVGENSVASSSANLSVFEDSEISPRKRSPMKRYLQSKANAVLYNAVENEDSFFDSTVTAAKVPRLSYERPKLRKRVVIAEQTAHSDASDSESSDSEGEEDGPAEMPFEIPAHKVVKKTKGTPKKKEAALKKKERGMTKKEEEELEKWAKMFNSQCDQVASFGLCVE